MSISRPRMPSKYAWYGIAACVAFILLVGSITFSGFASSNASSASSSATTASQEATTAAMAATKASNNAANAAKAAKIAAQNTNTLLTNGKTTSAQTSKKIETQTLEIENLIKLGKTAGALNSKQAAKNTAAGLKVINQIETQFKNENEALATDIFANRASGAKTRALVCQLLVAAEQNKTPVYLANCKIS